MDRSRWEEGKARLAAIFRTRTRAEWCEMLDRTETCFSPVLSWDEAASHPQIRARGTLVDVDGVMQPAPAPRFSRTPLDPPKPPAARSWTRWSCSSIRSCAPAAHSSP